MISALLLLSSQQQHKMYAALWLLPLGQSIETIATSQSFAAAAQGFAYPHMDSKQRIFFQAYGNSNLESIVQYDASLSTVVSTAAGVFSSVQAPSASDDALAFTGIGPSEQGIYVAQLATGKGFDPVARVGKDSFEQVANPSIAGGKAIAFGGQRDGLTGIYAAFYSGVWGDAHTLVNASTPQPALPHLHPPPKLRCVQDASISQAGYVAFFGSSCTSSKRGGGRTALAQRMYRTRPASEHAVHIDADAPHVIAGIYLATLPSSSSGDGSDGNATGGTWPLPGEAPLTVAADTMMRAPASSSSSSSNAAADVDAPAVTFTAFSSPMASGPVVAFIGSTSDGQLGIFRYHTGSRTLKKVVDTATAVPGAPAGNMFSDFPYVPSVRVQPSGVIKIVFYAAAGGTASGLYVYSEPPAHEQGEAADDDSSSSSNKKSMLRKLVTMGDTLDGESIAFLGAGAASSDASAAVFYAVTGTNGVYKVPL